MPDPAFGSFDYSLIQGIPEVRIRIRRLQERLLAKSGEGRMLEVGLGAGDVTLMLSDTLRLRGKGSLTCVDLSEENIELARTRLGQERAAQVRFCCAPIETAPLDGTFDDIVLLGLLEHLENPVPVLERLRSLLAPNGILHVTVNLAHSLHRLLGVEMGQISDVEALSANDVRLGHYRVYSLPQLRGHLQAAGLAILQEEPFYLKPLPTSMLTDLPMALHEGLEKLGERFPEFASYVYLTAGETLKNRHGA